MKLSELLPDERGQVTAIPEELGRRLEKMGFAVGGEVRCLFRAPLGDPTAYLVKGAAVALRKKDAENIEVKRWV